MEATQALDFALDSSDISREDTNENDNNPKKLVGVLQIEEDQKEYNAFQGDVISIGRDPENCQVILENKVRK